MDAHRRAEMEYLGELEDLPARFGPLMKMPVVKQV